MLTPVRPLLVLALAGGVLLAGPAARAQYPDPNEEAARTAPAASTPAGEKKADDRKEPALTPQEIAERDARKACKVEICAAFRAKKAGPDIACDVLKTWRKEQLEKMVSKAKVSWPWGQVQCTAGLKLKRDMLLKAVSEPKHEAELDTHKIVCKVDRDKEPASDISIEFKPKVSFENGKAVKASINWGKLEAPTLVKGAIWTATATDNTFNVLAGTLTEDINDFMTKKCDEVREDWASK